jgi:hypothetical protein
MKSTIERLRTWDSRSQVHNTHLQKRIGEKTCAWKINFWNDCSISLCCM